MQAVTIEGRFGYSYSSIDSLGHGGIEVGTGESSVTFFVNDDFKLVLQPGTRSLSPHSGTLDRVELTNSFGDARSYDGLQDRNISSFDPFDYSSSVYSWSVERLSHPDGVTDVLAFSHDYSSSSYDGSSSGDEEHFFVLAGPDLDVEPVWGERTTFDGSFTRLTIDDGPLASGEPFSLLSLVDGSYPAPSLPAAVALEANYARPEDGASGAVLSGGDGVDTIIGASRNDTLSGWAQVDRIDGAAGHDLIAGGAARDFLRGGTGYDVIGGGTGNDSIEAGPGRDTVYAGAGNDRVEGGLGADHLKGGLGNDDMLGGSGDDHLSGGHGDDVLRGNNGNDRLVGGFGEDTILGEDGDDTIGGGQGRDGISGGDGDDDIAAGAGADEVFGGSGNDILRGGPWRRHA